MEKILFITDYIEGMPVVASVRYQELMKYYNKNFEIIVFNDEKYGNLKSVYSIENFKYKTSNTKYTQNIYNKENKKKSKIEKLVRNNLVLKLWRTIKYSESIFINENKNILNFIIKKIKEDNINKVLITVPDLYGIYAGKYIKHHIPKIKIITEIRDILNNDIGNGNPKWIFKKSEKTLINISDGVITLSEGIFNYYKKNYKVNNMKIIKNGFNNSLIDDLKIKNRNVQNKITFVHLGSIYKGRNIKDFILALNDFSKNDKRNIIFNIVGYLDNQAVKDINSLQGQLDSENLTINIVGTVKHEKAMEYLINADIGVILTHIKGSDFAIPGKTFEYIGAEKPIIAITTDKTLIKFVDKKYGEIASHDKKDIVKKIRIIISKKYDFSDKKKYTRENQAKAIVKYLNCLN